MAVKQFVPRVPMSYADAFHRGRNSAIDEINTEQEARAAASDFLTWLAKEIRSVPGIDPITVAEHGNHIVITVNGRQPDHNMFIVRWYDGWLIEAQPIPLSQGDMEKLSKADARGKGEDFDAAEVILEALGYWIQMSSD